MRIHLIVPALAVACLAAGCGSDDQPKATATTATPTASAASSVPEQLLGAYTRDVTKADIARTARFRNEAGPNQSEPSPGPVRIEVTADGLKFEGEDPTGGPVLKIDQDFSATAAGELEIEGYQHPEIGSFCGPEIPQNASYSWRVDGTTLRLKATSDRCADRDSTLTGDWRRAS